jgi:TonB-linked SusC/RagA family outer membrane protein
MNFILKRKAHLSSPKFGSKIWLVMKLTTMLIIIGAFQVSARTYGQKITFSGKDVPLQRVFEIITEQTGFGIFYKHGIFDKSVPVTLEVKDAPIADFLNELFKGQPIKFEYTIEGNSITIIKKTLPVENIYLAPYTDIRGKVTNEMGEPLVGATIKVKGTKKITETDIDGNYYLKQVESNATIVISYTGHISREVKLNGADFIPVTLLISTNPLDAVQIIAYGTTTKRLNTGNVSTVTSKEIEEQPISNPLAALEGRVPGLIVTQSSGLNGASFNVQLRGQNSILQGSDPFFIIDGVPFAPGNIGINQITNAAGTGGPTSQSYSGLSPFNLINPADIESIEVLKDADATAIYGSRGANGVILITTKKGRPGKTRITANLYSGISQITRAINMMNTKQYVEMRREAFKNDTIPLSTTAGDPGYAPDITIWDTSRYTNFEKLLIGGTAHLTESQLSITGGNSNTQFLLSGGYHYQTTVFPSDLGDGRASAHFNLNHNSSDKKFSLNLNTNFTSDKNDLNITDLTQYVNLPPNLKLYDSRGNLNWEEGGVQFYNSIFKENPLALLNAKYTGKFNNLISNLQMNYQLFPAFNIKLNLGYNLVASNELNTNPSTSIDPNSGNLPSSNFANQTQKSTIIEPQLEYKNPLIGGKLDILVGSTWQGNNTEGIVVNAVNYSSDVLLGSISGAGSVSATNINTQYRYDAFFGRVNYNYQDKYLVNLSGRRDGSSRFGPGRQFSNFGAIGAAWVFSNENFIKQSNSILSFGKIRASYGLTGNDQIGDYKYLDTWTANFTTYQGVSTLNPTSLYNPNYSWEVNKKLEISNDLGFFKDRILLSSTYFLNKCGNQLVDYTLPIQTGFPFVSQNLNALIQNRGFEFSLTTKNIVGKNLTWETIITLTTFKNKLVKFPGLASSSYSDLYIIGMPITARPAFIYQGVDPQTGVYKFKDVNHDGVLDISDQVSNINPRVKYFAGIINRISYKQFELEVFFEIKEQTGYNYLNTYSLPAFQATNQPTLVLNRWRQPGDITNIQKYTASVTPALISGIVDLPQSDATVSDASYIRCKNISISYTLTDAMLKRLHIANASLFIHAQNVFTITKYIGSDPENQAMFILPPLRSYTVGINLGF